MKRNVIWVIEMVVAIVVMAFCLYLFYEGQNLIALLVAIVVFGIMCLESYRADFKAEHSWCDQDFIRNHRVR